MTESDQHFKILFSKVSCITSIETFHLYVHGTLVHFLSTFFGDFRSRNYTQRQKQSVQEEMCAR